MPLPSKKNTLRNTTVGKRSTTILGFIQSLLTLPFICRPLKCPYASLRCVALRCVYLMFSRAS